MKNPTIKITQVGKKMFNYHIKISTNDSDKFYEYFSVGKVGEEIELDIYKRRDNDQNS